MANLSLIPVTGIIQSIRQAGNNCCEQQVSILNNSGITNFIISPSTYVINETRLRQGMTVTAFYDGNLPVPLIFPPQYRAMIIGVKPPREIIFAGNFNNRLVSSDNALQLNVSNSTDITTANGQRFTCSPGGHLLIVFYSTTTRSIPPQTTPRRIIVMC